MKSVIPFLTVKRKLAESILRYFDQNPPKWELKSSGKFWTKDEIDFLKKVWITKTKRQILKKLEGRTWLAIRHKASKLGLKGRPKGFRLVNLRCENCGKNMKRYPSEVKNHVFCSYTCFKEWRRKVLNISE